MTTTQKPKLVKIIPLVLALMMLLSLTSCGGKKTSKEMSQIQWPDSEIAELLPKPESSVGVINWDNSDGFSIEIGETTKEQYEAYVSACKEKGFKVDYTKTDDSYYADNEDGYSLSLYYEDGDIMTISISSPAEETEPSEAKIKTTSAKKETSKAKTTVTTKVANVSWREFLKEYEAWVDDYIEVVKKYKANPSDMSILSDYTRMLTELSDWSEKADDIETEITDTQDALEYSQEILRIAGKLAEVAD